MSSMRQPFNELKPARRLCMVVDDRVSRLDVPSEKQYSEFEVRTHYCHRKTFLIPYVNLELQQFYPIYAAEGRSCSMKIVERDLSLKVVKSIEYFPGFKKVVII